jgi:hypothetical protein
MAVGLGAAVLVGAGLGVDDGIGVGCGVGGGGVPAHAHSPIAKTSKNVFIFPPFSFDKKLIETFRKV